MNKKVISLLMCGVLTASMLIGGCGQSKKHALGVNAKDTGKVIILYPGEETDEMANFINNELNPTAYRELYAIYLRNATWNYSSPRTIRLSLSYNF